MKLLTKEQAKMLPKLYETEEVPRAEKLAVAKLFHPASAWTWYIIEYDGKDTCWGLVVSDELEFGHFSLGEISQVIGPLGLPVERDRYFQPTQLQDLPVHNIERVVA